jgi:hypothetical protein
MIYSGKKDGTFGFHLAKDGLDPYFFVSYELYSKLCEDTNRIVFDEKTGEPSLRERNAQELAPVYEKIADDRLDEFARQHGFRDIASAVTYANDPDPAFKRDGKYCLALRSQTYRTCYEIMNAVLSGQRKAPSLKELLEELPAMHWPE